MFTKQRQDIYYSRLSTYICYISQSPDPTESNDPICYFCLLFFKGNSAFKKHTKVHYVRVLVIKMFESSIYGKHIGIVNIMTFDEIIIYKQLFRCFLYCVILSTGL